LLLDNSRDAKIFRALDHAKERDMTKKMWRWRAGALASAAGLTLAAAHAAA